MADTYGTTVALRNLTWSWFPDEVTLLKLNQNDERTALHLTSGTLQMVENLVCGAAQEFSKNIFAISLDLTLLTPEFLFLIIDGKRN